MNHLRSMKLILKFATPPFVLCQFHLLQFSRSYFEMEDDEDKEKSKLNKVAEKAPHQLKGFIGSIKPKNRYWSACFFYSVLFLLVLIIYEYANCCASNS